MGSKLDIWGFLSVKKTSSFSSTQCLPWQHNTAAVVNQSMSFEALGKVCGKSKRKEYVIHVNSSTMNTWMSRSWSLPRELPWSVAKSAIFLFFQHFAERGRKQQLLPRIPTQMETTGVRSRMLLLEFSTGAGGWIGAMAAVCVHRYYARSTTLFTLVVSSGFRRFHRQKSCFLLRTHLNYLHACFLPSFLLTSLWHFLLVSTILLPLCRCGVHGWLWIEGSEERACNSDAAKELWHNRSCSDGWRLEAAAYLASIAVCRSCSCPWTT